jgi:hypothetical protein
MTLNSERRKAELAVIDASRAWVAGVGRLSEIEDTITALDMLPMELAVTGARPSSLSPETSWDAYWSMKSHLGNDSKLVLDAITLAFQRGSTGLTTEQVCNRLDRKHQSISARVNELRDKGWIKDSGEKRRTTSGRWAIVWSPSDTMLARE